jgi:ectoine hydroxylase-related dioxygenase (phytanoyl-CoA dioxygenase family)
MVMRSPAFVRLLENEKMHRVFARFLDDTCILYSSTSTILKPRQKHYTCEIHTDTPRLVPGYHLGLLMTLACDDFTEENGATYYLPGSQRFIEKPSDEEFYTGAVRVTRKAGDAAFFHPRVWHAGGINVTGTERVGCTVYAVRSWMKQRFDYPRMVDDRVLSLLGERGRAFLGFNTRVPTNMREFFRKPDDRLYKSGQG